MSNLLNKASIIITPTGYDTGYLLGIKPSVPFGSELVSETTDNISGWIEARNKSTLSIVDNNIRATRTDVGAETIGVSSTVFTTVVGRKYRIKVNATKNNTNGNIYVRVSDSSNVSGTYFSQQNATNAISVDINFVATATTAYVGILATSQDTGNYVQSNLMSIKEDVGADLEFSRASTATRTNALQTIENVSINVPRIDYTGGVGNILLEPQSTNLVTYSEDFSKWTLGSNSTLVLDNSVTAPDGSTGVYRLTLPATSGTFIQSNTFSAITGTLSIYVKSAGTVNNDFGLYSGFVASPLKTATSEWQRFTLENVTSNSLFITNFADTFISDIYIWGGQVEQKSFLTSYIPTVGSTVTRLQETLNNSGNADLFNDTEGVLYAEIKALSNYNTQRFLGISDGSDTNKVILGFNNSATNYIVLAETKSGGSTTSFMTYDLGTVAPSFLKIALKYKANDFALWVNGTERVTDSSGAAPVGLIELAFDRGNGASDFEGKTKCVAVFKEALTDVQLQCLTS